MQKIYFAHLPLKRSFSIKKQEGGGFRGNVNMKGGSRHHYIKGKKKAFP